MAEVTKEYFTETKKLVEKYGEMLDNIKKEYVVLKNSFNQEIIDSVD